MQRKPQSDRAPLVLLSEPLDYVIHSLRVGVRIVNRARHLVRTAVRFDGSCAFGRSRNEMCVLLEKGRCFVNADQGAGMHSGHLFLPVGNRKPPDLLDRAPTCGRSQVFRERTRRSREPVAKRSVEDEPSSFRFAFVLA